MNRGDVDALLAANIKRAGSLRAYARQLDVSAAYLSDVMRHNREPGPRLLHALGFTKVVTRLVQYLPAASSSPPIEAPTDRG